ncbi:hypothetical protein ACVW0P_000574 [Mucilaginibacter sp. UYNi724]
MENITNFISSQSILIPIFIGIIRYKGLYKTYNPFFILLILGLIAEIISFIFINIYRHGNAPIIKIYSLVECCIILHQLYLWKSTVKYKYLFYFLTATCAAFWVIEVLVFGNLNTFSPYFRVFYAFIIVLLSINQINAMMFYHNDILLKNPKFVISLGFIIFFLYQIIYEASFYIGYNKSIVANKIIIGFGYINLFTNLIYAIAIFLITQNNKDGYNSFLSDNKKQRS